MFCFPFHKINDDNVKVFPHIVLNRLVLIKIIDMDSKYSLFSMLLS